MWGSNEGSIASTSSLFLVASVDRYRSIYTRINCYVTSTGNGMNVNSACSTKSLMHKAKKKIIKKM